jgi:ferrous-iron efflux pump FieF
MLASLTDSLMDSMASLVNLLAIRYALQPADEDHRFGHGKAESIAAVAQAAFMIGSSVLLLLYCVEGLWSAQGHELTGTAAGLVVSALAIALTLGLLALQTHAIRLSGSETLRADRLHYRSDLLINLSVMVALAAASFGLAWIDLLFGIGIALYIGLSAAQIGREALHGLMDRELPDPIREEIRDLAVRQHGVEGMHRLRTRRSGRDYVIQMHLEIDDSRPLIDAHAIADGVEAAIRERYPNADVIIHQDPASLGADEPEPGGQDEDGTIDGPRR